MKGELPSSNCRMENFKGSPGPPLQASGEPIEATLEAGCVGRVTRGPLWAPETVRPLAGSCPLTSSQGSRPAQLPNSHTLPPTDLCSCPGVSRSGPADLL